MTHTYPSLVIIPITHFGCKDFQLFRSEMAETAAMISAIAGAISAGASIAGTTSSMVESCGHRVVCGVEVSNATKFNLAAGECYIHNGQIKVPHSSIGPAKKETFLGHQTGALCSGTTGVTAWKIGDTNVHLLVLWSAPYNFDHYANWLGIGFQTSNSDRVTIDKSVFDDMYYETQTWFQRQDYYNNVIPIDIEDSSKRFKATGTMGTTHKSEVKIMLQPKKKSDMARALQDVVY